MASKPEPAAPHNLDEERLAHALISRGLVSREDLQQCRSSAGNEQKSPESLLERLVHAGFLTAHQAQRATQELSLLLGQQIPGYQLLEKLGQGSMGSVYKARQISMNRLVAVKVLLPRLAANPEFLQRLTGEAHLAAKLSHNNIVQAIDVGSAGNIHYFVMEYVEGTTLKQELESAKKYTEKEAIEIVLQIAQALRHGHRRGLVHRDIKPANIIMTAERIAKLADLGMAREMADQTRARAEKGMTIGTPFYIAPEQIHGQEDIDVRADVYSLGATFYHLVTGQPPFPGNKVDAVLKSHLEDELIPPDHLNLSLSAGLGEVVEFMMAKDRRQRYRTPDDLILDLECLLNGDPPKLARQRIHSASLQELAAGDAEEEDDDRTPATEGVPLVWVIVLGVGLGLSVLLNLILFLRK